MDFLKSLLPNLLVGGLFFINTLAFAENIVLEGKIGKHPILMELNISDTEVTGKYAYKNNLVAIHLEGKDLSHLTEFKLPPRIADWEEIKNYQSEPNAVFSGKLINNHYQGAWQVVGRKTKLIFDLKIVQDTRTQLDLNSYRSLFESKIANQITFSPVGDKNILDNGLALQSYEDPITKTHDRRIFLDNIAAQKNINETLKNQHIESVEKSLWCLAEGYNNPSRSVGHVMDISGFEVNYYMPPLLEISYSGSIYCGGAHPANYYTIINFDTSTGEKIDLKNLFNIFNDDETLSDEFISILQKHIVSDNDCFSEEAGAGFTDLGFHITKENHLAIKYNNLGHAMFACELDNIANIPVTELKLFALPSAARYFPVLK